MSESKKGTLLALLSGVVFGIMPSTVTYCYSQGLNSTGMLLIRFALIVILTFPMMRKGGSIAARWKKYWWKYLCISGASAVTPLLLFESYKYIATGLTTTLHFLYPTVVAVMCWVFFHDRMSRFKLLCLCLCLSGILLLLDTSQTLDPLGVALALASSVSYSIYIVGIDKFDLGKPSSVELLFFVEAGNLVLVSLYGFATGAFHMSVTPQGWAVALVANLAIAVCGHMFFLLGVRYAGPQTAAIVSTFEPITSIFIGVLFMSEPFGVRTAAGSALVLLAVILLSAFGDKEPRTTKARNT